MRKYIIVLLLTISCTSPSLDGTWKLRLHEAYDNNKTVGLQEAPKPFEEWKIEAKKLQIDGVEEFYSSKNDSITITFQGDFRHFTIIDQSETSLLLKSDDLTPGTYSFYYFFK